MARPLLPRTGLDSPVHRLPRDSRTNPPPLLPTPANPNPTAQEQFQELLAKYKMCKGSALCLNHIISSFSPDIIAQNSLALTQLIREADDTFPKVPSHYRTLDISRYCPEKIARYFLRDIASFTLRAAPAVLHAGREPGPLFASEGAAVGDPQRCLESGHEDRGAVPASVCDWLRL